MSHKREREARRLEAMKADLYRQTAARFPGQLPHMGSCLFTHVERSGIEVLVGEQLKLQAPLSIKLMSGQLYNDTYIALAIHRSPEELAQLHAEITQHAKVKIAEVTHEQEQSQGAPSITESEGGQGPVGPMGNTAADDRPAEAPLPSQEIQAGPVCEEGQGPLLPTEGMLAGPGMAPVIPSVISRCGAGEPTISEDPCSDGGEAGQ